MRWYFWALIVLVVVVVVSQINRLRVMKNLKEIKLSENFTADEFVVTATGAENVPGDKEIEALRVLCVKILQPLRNAVNKPIHINSGYRSPAVNALVPGSSSTSQHMKGQAADIHIDGMSVADVIAQIRKLGLPYDQLIDEQRGSSIWTHVSYNNNMSDANQRRQWLTRRDPGPGRPNEYVTVLVG